MARPKKPGLKKFLEWLYSKDAKPLTNEEIDQWLTKTDQRKTLDKLTGITLSMDEDGKVRIPVRDMLYGITKNGIYWD